MRQLITVGIQAAAHPAQRNHAGASQRGNVHDRCRLEARRIGERIAQHQTSFGIGVENFDGLSAHAGDHITRLHGAAVGHVFARRDQTHHVDGLQLGQGLEHAQHAGRPHMSNFISSISPAGLMEIPPVSKVCPCPPAPRRHIFASTTVVQFNKAQGLLSLGQPP
jgi:hypothetical protein